MAEEKAELGSVGAAFALVYGSGLVTSNIFLGHLGLADFSLLKPKAVFTGAIVLASLAALAAGPIHLVAQLRDEKKQIPRPFTRRFLLISSTEIVVPLSVVFAICCLVKAHPERSLSALMQPGDFIASTSHPFLNSLILTIGFFLSSFAVAVTAVESFRLLNRLKEAISFPGISTRLAKLIFLLAACLLSLSLYIDLFAVTFYIFIPQALGGGSPEEKSLLIQSDSVQALKGLGFEFIDDHSSLTKPVSVLSESDDSLGVIVKVREVNPNPAHGIESAEVDNLVVVRLDRKMIQATIIHAADVPGIEVPVN
jgi:hypothetical protein